MGDEPDKKKPSFPQRLREAFNGVSRKDVLPILKDTLKDLRHPQEIGLLVGCSFVPGGWIGYGIYRVAKFKLKRAAANDNPEKPGNDVKPAPPKPPKP